MAGFSLSFLSGRGKVRVLDAVLSLKDFLPSGSAFENDIKYVSIMQIENSPRCSCLFPRISLLLFQNFYKDN